MSLQTNVVARIPDRRLRELTNADDRAATTANTTILALACTDAASLFAERCGATYDDTVAGDVRVSVPLVVAILIEWTTGVRDDLDKALEAAGKYSLVRGRNRSAGATTSLLTPSTEVQLGEEIRPWSDQDSFDGYSPRSP